VALFLSFIAFIHFLMYEFATLKNDLPDPLISYKLFHGNFLRNSKKHWTLKIVKACKHY